MKIYFTKSFKKNYAKRIKPYKNLEERFEHRYDLFLEYISHPLLKGHALS